MCNVSKFINFITLFQITDMADITEDRILRMLHGRNIFITGGTGFLGKVLIEKLLRYEQNGILENRT